MLRLFVLGMMIRSTPALAPNSQPIGYQEFLMVVTSVPLNKSCPVISAIQFALIDNSLFWAEIKSIVASNGSFNLLLDSSVPLTGCDSNDQNRELAAGVESEPVLALYRRFVSLPFVFAPVLSDTAGYAPTVVPNFINQRQISAFSTMTSLVTVARSQAEVCEATSTLGADGEYVNCRHLRMGMARCRKTHRATSQCV